MAENIPSSSKTVLYVLSSLVSFAGAQKLLELSACRALVFVLWPQSPSYFMQSSKTYQGHYIESSSASKC